LLCILQKTDGEVKLGFNGDLYPTSGASVVMTTSGDMVKYQSGARARLGIGSANQILQVKSSLPSWETVDLADTVLTTAGDVLFENATPELARLPKGTQYYNLQMGSALPAWSASSSSILSASGDILYASGSNTLAKLAKASDGDTLQLASGVPAWVTVASGSTLTKVTKSYSDIVAGTASMAIYTLPADQALVNAFTDVTTVFDLSTAVTIGDGSDDNGFQQATNWTSGTGLTSATRGAYVTSFKGMRSTSGTTAISAYNFTLVGGSTFTQSNGSAGRGIQQGGIRQEIAQQYNAGHVLVDEPIISASFFLQGIGSPAGDVKSFIREADGTEVQESSTVLDATTTTGSSVEYTFDFPRTTLEVDEMITISGADMTNGSLDVMTNAVAMTDGTLYSNNAGTYTELTNEQIKGTVTYGTQTSDTQGAVDFYLQIAST